MGNSLVSFMIPTSNDAATLDRCLRSVLDQDYDNFMVVALDNQSVDGTYDILVDFEKQYRDRLYIGRTYTRFSPLAHRRQCLQLTNPRSKFRQFFSATDTLASGYLSRCIELFESNKNIGCVLVHADVITPLGTIKPAIRYRPDSGIIPGMLQMEAFMLDGLDLNTTQIFRSEVYALSEAEGFLFNRFPSWLPLIMASSISDMGYIHETLALRGDAKSNLGEQFIPCTEDFFERYLFLQAFSTIAARLGRSHVCDRLPEAVQRLSQECLRCSEQLWEVGNLPAARSYRSLALAFFPEIADTREFKQTTTSY